jgi:predicted nucleic acid-binding protein
MPKRSLIDTNIILRFLLNDNLKQAEEAEKLFEKSENNSLEVPDLVFAEIYYVLTGYYKVSKKEAVSKIHAILEFEKFKVSKKLILETLNQLESRNISFVDAYLYALTRTNHNKRLYTFDKALSKLDKKKIVTP